MRVWMVGVWIAALGLVAFGGKTIEVNLTVDGRERMYLAHIPGATDKPLPVVFVFHGGGGRAVALERGLGFNELAEKEGFLAVYPQGYENHWNDGRQTTLFAAQRENVDDVAFVRRIVDDLARRVPVDRSRIFSTGASNGGIFSYMLATTASDLVAAIAPVIGGLAEPLAGDWKPTHRVSLFVIQSSSDALVPMDGGPVGIAGMRERGRVIPMADAVAKFVALDGITGKPTVATLPDVNPGDGTTTKVTRYPSGPDGHRVLVYVVQNGGHRWQGRPGARGNPTLAGRSSADFNGERAIWEFFKTCPPHAAKDDRSLE